MEKKINLFFVSPDDFKITDTEHILISGRTKNCKYCGGLMQYMCSGIYICRQCAHQETSDANKIKNFLDENGPMPEHIISIEAKVEKASIQAMLQNNKLKVMEVTDNFLHCKVCGGEIRNGRICPECIEKTGQRFRNFNPISFNQNASDDETMHGRFRYIKKENHGF